MSMVFVKEKSVVKGYLDGKYTGCFDFATGAYYGIRGGKLKNNPKGLIVVLSFMIMKMKILMKFFC